MLELLTDESELVFTKILYFIIVSDSTAVVKKTIICINVSINKT